MAYLYGIGAFSHSWADEAASAQRAHRRIGIRAAAYCLPGPAIDVLEWAPAQNVAPGLIERLLANGCRYFHDGTGMSDADLVANAIDRLRPQCAFDAREVAYLIHAHTQPFSVPAAPDSVLSCIVGRFSYRPKLSFSVEHLACASVVHAVEWGARLLETDRQARYALIVTADRVFGAATQRIRQDATIQSDGGSAVLLAREDVRCWLGSTVTVGFTDLHEGPSTPENVARVARYTWMQTTKLLRKLGDGGLALSEYGVFLPINADRRYWRLIARALELPEERFYLDNIRNRGHACCADFAVNLADESFARLEAGEVVAYCGQSNIGAHGVISLFPVQAQRAGGAP